MPAPKVKRPFITPAEAARRLGLNVAVKHPVRTVQGMARRGELTFKTMDGLVMIDPDSVDAMLGGVAADTDFSQAA